MRIAIELDRGTCEKALAFAREASEKEGLSLEDIFSALVEDMAVGLERPGSWEAFGTGGWLSSHPFYLEGMQKGGAS